MYGHLDPISTAEYLQIYRQTGIDIDGRTEILNRDANLMERVVLMFVKLYRSFPGYNNLPIEDQASVLKGTFNHIFAPKINLQAILIEQWGALSKIFYCVRFSVDVNVSGSLRYENIVPPDMESG